MTNHETHWEPSVRALVERAKAEALREAARDVEDVDLSGYDAQMVTANWLRARADSLAAQPAPEAATVECCASGRLGARRVTTCETCWDDAYIRARMLGGSQVEHYQALLTERAYSHRDRPEEAMTANEQSVGPDAETLRNEVAEVLLLHEQSLRDADSDNWRCTCGQLMPWPNRSTHRKHVADALLPLLARVRATAETVALGQDHAYERGLQEGEARVRERVEAVLRSSWVDVRTHGDAARLIRAALAEPTGETR